MFLRFIIVIILCNLFGLLVEIKQELQDQNNTLTKIINKEEIKVE